MKSAARNPVPASAKELANAEFARELFDYCLERLAYFKAPAYVLFVDGLPTTSSQKIQTVKIFPPGVNARQQPGVIDVAI